MAVKVFVDTNVLLRATLAVVPLHAQALELVRTQRQAGNELWISRQVIREFLAQVTRPQAYQPHPLTVDEVAGYIRGFPRAFRIADETARVTLQLLALLREFPTGGKQIHDANIVATMLAYDLDTLLTQNVDDFARFSSKITIIPLT